MIIAVVGAQWGDEGKGKVVDILGQRCDVVARYQGGHNAGHTVVTGGKQYILHALPSGVLEPGVTPVIGNGVVLNPHALVSEIYELKKEGIKCDRLKISDRCHLILPYHEELEKIRELQLGKNAIGTTLRGIGLAYEDKSRRIGIRAGETKNLDKLMNHILKNFEETNLEIIALGGEPLNPNYHVEDFISAAGELSKYVCDTAQYLNSAADAKLKIILEGAQGTMLDIDHGSYPFVTSSSPNLGGAITGTGISPFLLDGALAIVKAYTTRVGGGAFATELTDELGVYLQKTGHEVGASTGRPRRCGWFDAVVVRYSQRINRFKAMCLMKLDVLDGLDEIKICTEYRGLEGMPSDWSDLDTIEPVYETLPGWKTDTTGIRRYADLPKNARNYIERIEQLCGMPTAMISVGPDRDQTIIRETHFLKDWFA